MLLDLKKAGVPMKLVYQLAKELENDPEQVRLAQALTLDTGRPNMGLKGTGGLFGSQAWWDRISRGDAPTEFSSGVVLRAYVAGQDGGGLPNTVDLLLADGSVTTAGIYVNDKADVGLFRSGCLVEIIYVLEELKRQPAPDGGVNYSKIALEMAVSLEPIKSAQPDSWTRPLKA